MNKSTSKIKIMFWLFGLGLFCQEAHSQQIKPSTSKEMREAVAKHQTMLADSPLRNYPARNIGPTNMSGRIVDIEVTNDFKTYYLAAASGGVWKTTDNGQTFDPIFDHQGALGIGDMAISQSNNNVLWVGTGENNSSRSTYAGSGVYKSTDGGKNWEWMGLPHSQHIGQIQIHPSNPEVVWVASMGSLYSRNEERGIYKTTDGGKTWKKTLYVDDNTGVIDLKVHPANPDVILAASWERFRQAHDFIGNGKGSSIWRSEDGGNTWKKAIDGIPQDEFVGRIGFDFSLSNPNIVYALHDYQKPQTREPRPAQAAEGDLTIENFKTMTPAELDNIANERLDKFLRTNRFAGKYNAASVKRLVKLGRITPMQIASYHGGGQDANASLFNSGIVGAEVYRSEDAGKTWKKVNESNIERLYNSYGYYFGEIRTSTQNPDEIFVLGVPLLVSRDGGKTYARSDTVGDVHSDHQSMWINPKDSRHLMLGTDGGLYISYGGGERWIHLNDQLTISQFYSVMVDENKPYNVYGGMQDNGVWFGKSTGKPEEPWTSLMGGDGMVVAVDTRTNDIIYTGFQFGNYFRINTKTNERKSVTPMHDIGRSPNRWNWRTPATLSKHNQDVFYMGSQYVYRSLDRGDSWETISPDLTKNQKSGNVPFATLTVIEESPFEFGTLYAGSDDGNLWVTRDHGNTWTDISKGLPQNRWVSSVAPSQHLEGTVYVTLTGYRHDEFSPYVFKSLDYGKTWTPLAGNLPLEAVNIIREDPTNGQILYLGTDHGLYTSLDGGKSYQLFQGNIPNVAIYDIAIQKRENELVVASHGRSVYIVKLDALQKIASNPTVEVQILSASEIRTASRRPAWAEAPTTPPSQSFMYYVKEASPTSLSIVNEQGEELKKWEASAAKGFNVGTWEYGEIAKGKYKIIASRNGQSAEWPFEVK